MRRRIIGLSLAAALSITALTTTAQAVESSVQTSVPTAPTSLVAPSTARSTGVQDVQVEYIDAPQGDIFGEVRVYPALGRTYFLQRNDGGTWVDVEAYPTEPDSIYDSIYPVPPIPAGEGVVEYRIYAPASTYDAEYASATVKVGYQAVSTYQAQRDQTQAIIAGYCPSLEGGVHYGAPMPDILAGLYYSGKKQLLIAPNVEGDMLHDVALHECAHDIQNRTATANGVKFQDLESILYPIYGDLSWDVGYDAQAGIEQNADCMTFVMGGIYDIGGYVERNQCTGAKYDAAVAILEGRIP